MRRLFTCGLSRLPLQKANARDWCARIGDFVLFVKFVAYPIVRRSSDDSLKVRMRFGAIAEVLLRCSSRFEIPAVLALWAGLIALREQYDPREPSKVTPLRAKLIRSGRVIATVIRLKLLELGTCESL